MTGPVDDIRPLLLLMALLFAPILVLSQCDSGSGPQGENSRSEVEGEAPQSGGSASERIAQPQPKDPSND